MSIKDLTHSVFLTLTSKTVASGIGITPTLSLVQAYQETKRVNVVWVCRDPGLIEYILQKVDLQAIAKYSFVLIFYTGERELVLPRQLPANFFLLRTRPNLERVVAGIVTCVESGHDLPEEMYMLQEEISNISFERRVKIGLTKIASAYSRDELFDFAVEMTEKKRSEVGGYHRNIRIPPPPSCSTGSSVSCASARSGSSYSNGDRKRYISRQGFEDMVTILLDGIGDYASDDIDTLFATVKTEDSKFIFKEDFDRFFDMHLGAEEEAILDKIEKGQKLKVSMTNLSGTDELSSQILDKRLSLSRACSLRGINCDDADIHVPAVVNGGAHHGGHTGDEVVQGADADPTSSFDIRADWVQGSARLKGGEDDERPRSKKKALGRVERNLCRSTSLADYATLPSGSNHGSISAAWGTESLAEDNTGNVGGCAFGGDDAIEFLATLSRDESKPLRNWGVFYCGGALNMKHTLKKIKKKYGISLSIEHFDW
jgi:hypothetical protein